MEYDEIYFYGNGFVNNILSALTKYRFSNNPDVEAIVVDGYAFPENIYPHHNAVFFIVSDGSAAVSYLEKSIYSYLLSDKSIPSDYVPDVFVICPETQIDRILEEIEQGKSPVLYDVMMSLKHLNDLSNVSLRNISLWLTFYSYTKEDFQNILISRLRRKNDLFLLEEEKRLLIGAMMYHCPSNDL